MLISRPCRLISQKLDTNINQESTTRRIWAVLVLHEACAVGRGCYTSQSHIKVCPCHEKLRQLLVLWCHVRELAHKVLVLHATPVHGYLHLLCAAGALCLLQAKHRLRKMHKIVICRQSRQPAIESAHLRMGFLICLILVSNSSDVQLICLG